MAWWIGLVWCVGILLSKGTGAYWALVELTAGPRAPRNGFDDYFIWLQTLLLVPATAWLGFLLLVARFGRPRHRWLIVAAMMTAMIAVSPLAVHVVHNWTSASSGRLFSLAWRPIATVSQATGVLVLLCALMSPRSVTLRGLALVAAATLLLAPIAHAFRIADLFTEPWLPRGRLHYLRAPYFLYEHARTLIHLLALGFVFAALRRPSAHVALLRIAAMTFPATLILIDFPSRMFLWSNLNSAEFLRMMSEVLTIAAPTVALLLWPRGSTR